MSLASRIDQARDAASAAVQAATGAISGKLPQAPSLNVRAPKKMITDAQYFNANVKAETLYRQLDSDSAVAKLEAMKKIIAQLSKGKDVSEYFPAVVKNVSNQSIEVKKLVYLYVIHYAEERHDEALLSIAHFQKDLTDKSQHVRALSLRVMSSIRVPIIVQIVLLAIRKCVSDPSPWVRKAAALAVPKMYRLNPSERSALVAVVDELLGDSSSMVLGAAAHAFSEVCSDRVELLHKHFRKLCRSLVDIDDWGQVVVLNTLLHYGRTQFLSPFGRQFLRKRKFYEDEGSSRSSGSSAAEDDDFVEYDMDQDHRLLLKSAIPLLQSNNFAVIVGLATLYFHLAPPSEFSQRIARALMRLMKSTRERQYMALCIIHSFASKRPSAFRSFVREFFVTQADPAFIQKLKIDVIALLADSSNVSVILREYKYYLHNSPEHLLVDTVRALGRVAFYNSDVSDTCLHTLAELTSHSNSVVVAESVVVTRHLLQKADPGTVDRSVSRLARLLDSLRLPVARASLVWLVGEHAAMPQVSQLAPDCFRKLVRGFAREEPAVKQQICILGAKLMLQADYERGVHDAVAALYQHMLQLCRYDSDFCLRDRARLCRALVPPSEAAASPALGPLREQARDFFITEKKQPDFHDPMKDRLRFQVGTLSHITNSSLPGYQPLPEFPTEQPDPSVRETQLPPTPSSSSGSSFYSSGSSRSRSSSSSSSAGAPRQGPPAAQRRRPASRSGSRSSSSESPRPRRRGNGAARRRSPPPSSGTSESRSSTSSSGAPRGRGGGKAPAKPPARKQVSPPPAAPAAAQPGGADLLDFMDFGAPPQSRGAKHADPGGPSA